MITNIDELIRENFNLRHCIYHKSSVVLSDSKADKKELLDAVWAGILMWYTSMRHKIEASNDCTNETD